jgi:hypothetical protein
MTPFFDRLAELERTHTSFAVATVVARRSPVSSHLGDRALIFADGRMEGFVGGSCSRDIVRRQGLAAIHSGRAVLLQIRPDASAEERSSAPNAERVVIPMGCSSEGAVDVYIEPHIPMRSLVIVGFTPVADALARLASSVEYKVARVVANDELRDVEAIAGVEVRSVEEFPTYLAQLDVQARGDLVERVVEMRQVVGGDFAHEGALNLIVADTPMQPAQEDEELREHGENRNQPVWVHRRRVSIAAARATAGGRANCRASPPVK